MLPPSAQRKIAAGAMGEYLQALDAAAESLSLFAVATQCALAWIFALLFVAFARTTSRSPHLRAWTLSFIARAVALTAIMARFGLPLMDRGSASYADGSTPAYLLYAVYQAGKFLSFWWLLEGILRFTGASIGRRRLEWVPPALVAAALLTLVWMDDVHDLLVVQCVLAIVTGLYGSWRLWRVRPEQRSLGTRTTATALLVQVVLWGLYLVPFSGAAQGRWPQSQSWWAFIGAQNSYFDLCVDVLLSAGLVVLMLQDLNRRQRLSEAERTRLRRELDNAEKLRSLGTLVSGVAHELNNPLSSILGFAESLAAPDGDHDRVRQAEIIREQTLRCRRIVRGLSTFSGKGSEILETVDTRALLERVVSGLELELRRREVLVTVDVPRPTPTLVGDRFALEQLVTNLLVNAMQVSPRGGTVRLAVRTLRNELELGVEDEGPGIAVELLPHIFDPFFTTRTTGEGMGLGLAVCHGIAKAHGGSIRVTNLEPCGTRMLVTLPWRRTRDAGAPALLEDVDAPRAPVPADRSIEVLVIEDEPTLCDVVRLLGRGRGWQVTVATDGAEGLRLLRADGPRHDVVLCDLRMAPPSGMDIHDVVALEQPELLERFLFMTGDLASREAHEFAQRCTRPILNKPLGRDELCTAVEGLAAERSAC